jgi:alkylation response protein AidB-like acyl-CoA dehydrogenase
MSMTQTTESYLSTVDQIANETVAAHAVRVDREGVFPAESIDALRRAGLFGLVSGDDVGGMGLGVRAAATVVERLARECASTAMVMCMHYAGTAVIEKVGPESVRRAIASGAHLSTLAFSEVGSRSQFWMPLGTARVEGDRVVLDARKSWSTSANHATAYVWSSKPLEGEKPSTVWLVPRDTPGVHVSGTFDGLGLRGNDSAPITAAGARIPRSAMLGQDGGGFSIMMEIVLPWFNVMNAACSVGIMESAVARTAKHAAAARFEHAHTTVADLPTARAYVARMRIKTDQARALWLDTIAAMEGLRGDVVLRVLESKAAANEAALEVTDLAVRVCGGAGFRKETGVERHLRDARAGAVMAPTSDALLDFIGKAVCGLPVF